MRYYVLIGQTLHGPLAVAEARRLPGWSPDTPVCPEDRDHNQNGSWSEAAAFPELLDASESDLSAKDGGVSRFWRSALAKQRVAQALASTATRPPSRSDRPLWAAAVLGSVLIAVLATWRSQPPGSPAGVSPAPPALSPTDQASLLLTANLPREEAIALRAAASMTVSAGQVQIILPPDGRTLRAEARFVYDPQRQELHPSNEAARSLLDIRSPQ